jgi:hypothetical protein
MIPVRVAQEKDTSGAADFTKRSHQRSSPYGYAFSNTRELRRRSLHDHERAIWYRALRRYSPPLRTENALVFFFQMWAWAVMRGWAPLERSYGDVAGSLFQNQQGGLPLSHCSCRTAWSRSVSIFCQ